MKKKVLVILLDAAEASLIEKWSDEGSLPNLKRLRESGAYARTHPETFWMAGLPWFPFYTGRSYEYFPIPFFVLWHPDKMRMIRPVPGFLQIPHFWRAFGANDPRAIVVDMPWVTSLTPFNGIEIAGWATHDTIFESPEAHPPEYRRWLAKRHRAELRFNEDNAPMSPREFLRVRNELVRMTAELAGMCVDLMREGPWDLFMVNFNTVHTAGHKLWDLTNVVGRYDEAQKTEMQDALRQAYIAGDQAVGRLVDAAGPDANVIVMAVHGMENNVCRNAALPEMLRRVLANEYLEGMPLQKRGVLQILRSLVPSGLRHAVKSRLPMHWQDRLTVFWRLGRGRWSRKKAVSLPADVQGMVRINLIGREAQGIVPPAEFEALCKMIADGLRTFVDADTREPIIKEISLVDPAARNLSTLPVDCFPDLTIDWVDTPAHLHRALYSPQYGSIPWPTPHRNPEGRSGNHLLRGFLMAAGPDIKSGTIGETHMMDLAPTILTMLGKPVPEEMDGKVLDILA